MKRYTVRCIMYCIIRRKLSRHQNIVHPKFNNTMIFKQILYTKKSDALEIPTDKYCKYHYYKRDVNWLGLLPGRLKPLAVGEVVEHLLRDAGRPAIPGGIFIVTVVTFITFVSYQLLPWEPMLTLGRTEQGPHIFTFFTHWFTGMEFSSSPLAWTS